MSQESEMAQVVPYLGIFEENREPRELTEEDDIDAMIQPYDGAVSGRPRPKWMRKRKGSRPGSSIRTKGLSLTPELEWDDDHYYFDSYSHHDIHELMLKDQVRTLTYKDAIELNKHLFKGKVVLDIGCGTGILSMFAAKAGAARVIGIDFSNMAIFARQIVKDNGLDSVITIMHCKVEDITDLPHGIKEVDIIISEWMGYCLLMESMLETVLHAKKKWLNKLNGILMPDKCGLYVTGMDDGGQRAKKVQLLQNYTSDLDMSHIAEMRKDCPLVCDVVPDHIATTCYQLIEINLNVVYEEELVFDRPFTLEAKQDRTVHAVVAYFTVDFSRCHTSVGFSTAPEAQRTHWKQTVFYLKTPIQALKGETVKGAFILRKYWRNPRGLHVWVHVDFMGKLMSVKETNEYILH